MFNVQWLVCYSVSFCSCCSALLWYGFTWNESIAWCAVQLLLKWKLTQKSRFCACYAWLLQTRELWSNLCYKCTNESQTFLPHIFCLLKGHSRLTKIFVWIFAWGWMGLLGIWHMTLVYHTHILGQTMILHQLLIFNEIMMQRSSTQTKTIIPKEIFEFG